MKKLLLLVLAVVAVAAVSYGVAVVAVDHYQKHQKQIPAPVATVSKTQADSELAAAKAAATTDRTSLVAQYNAQVIECQKGSVAYAKLPTITKNQTPAPVCGTALVQ